MKTITLEMPAQVQGPAEVIHGAAGIAQGQQREASIQGPTNHRGE
jgi:hypothetical protein